jgi:cellulose synthase/poly-beta-1,6-N-acetylglucosamine synthase-like glycosyltransferase
MVTFYLLFGILYGAILLWLGNIWARSAQSEGSDTANERVTILLPFRNEAEYLPKLLPSLLALNHRPFEVVFIDDHSEDAGAELLKVWIKKNEDEDVSLALIQNRGQGKKEAIETGIGIAQGDIILTTDADCQLPADWVGAHLLAFTDQEVQLVAGPVMSQGSSTFLEIFQQIEWASILLMTQMGFTLRRPFMCSAANMAYRKKAFLKVGGYTGNRAYLSGDDEFLLKKISQTYGGRSTGYLQDNRVWTKSEPSWKMLYAQRVRWASKWRLHASFGHALLSFIPFLTQLLFLGSVALVSKSWTGTLVFFLLWSLKIVVEKSVLKKVMEDFGIYCKCKYFLLASVWHPFYVLYVGYRTAFGKIQWKGRKSIQFD